ncbi:hypothetical protein BLOT_002785 [Blomia tropicalis]|nr:hypothetical protein BLOT_002785 [Blomia tropicalis]
MLDIGDQQNTIDNGLDQQKWPTLTKKHGTIHWENLIGDHSIKKKPRFMIDFDPYNSCDPATSNAGFCERSTVFANLIALIGEKSSDMFTWDRNKSKIIPYQYAKTLISENDFSLIPSTNLRMFALLKDLFDQMSHNRHLLFTGATYEHFRDSLFTVATVIDDRIINRKSWINARHVLMRANFIPSDKRSSSPIMKPIIEPIAERDMDLPISSFVGSLMPHLPVEIKFVDSSLLVGNTYIIIVILLSSLLLFILLLDFYIICNLKRNQRMKQMEGPISPMATKPSTKTGSSTSTHTT